MLNKFFSKNNLTVYQNDIMQNNSVVITENNSVYIIDPGFDTKELIKLYNSYENKYILLTHSHYDHCGGDFNLLNNWSTQIYLSKNLKKWIPKLDQNLFFKTPPDHNKITFVSDKFKLNNFIFYLSPGHSIDSMCIKYNNIFIITGDHIFANSIGRTDLLTSDPVMMNESLNKMKKIIKNKNYIIIPGHGDIVSSNELLENNPFL